MVQQAEERHLKVGDFMSSPVVTVGPDTNFVDRQGPGRGFPEGDLNG
jgi:hypothetical protein